MVLLIVTLLCVCVCLDQDGPYAQEALQWVDIDYLTAIDGRLIQRWRWLKMANLLGIPDGPDRYRLRLIQEFITIT